ncbi:tetratricopeptide (TPR) repeat protein [Catenulispora sp. MAP12-49]|uniref:tetratricopeptide repeat protein n=1 Tax=Catenulispora sp. MAP12-49 TaxID=3156302 RepID=UPI0035112445
MTAHGQADVPDVARGRMLRALRELGARASVVRRVSGLSLIAVLCASAVAPVALVGQTIGPAIAAWLATAGSIGSNVLADVIISTVSQRSQEGVGEPADLELAVAIELEARMAGGGPEAATLRDAVAHILSERGAQQVLLETLAEGDVDLQIAVAESVALLGGRFDEFAGLLDGVRNGIRDLQRATVIQHAENQAQAEHRSQVQGSLDQILVLLGNRHLPPDATGVAFKSLPPDTAAFTGREAEIDEIAAHVAASAAGGGLVSIHAIDGMPGVGKTALAVHVAHLLADRFPDGQLFVDLHSHTAGRAPADPAATLAGFLTSDGLDPLQLPTGLEELTSLWRARMAGRRVLLVLDNAACSAQVVPLMPAGEGSLVLITSRRHLGDLPYPVTEVFLDALPLQDAVAMFLRLAPRGEGDEEQVAHLVTLAGCLPLAISLLARVYTRHRAWSVSELIEETRVRLLNLGAEQHTVEAAFDLSYLALTRTRRRFLRLLALHPGSDLDAYAAAALTGTGLAQARAHLDGLHGDNLVTEPGYRRYGLHDLIRFYARSHSKTSDPDEQREAALDRLLHFYAHTAKAARAASLAISRPSQPTPNQPPPAEAPNLADHLAARAWLRAERPNVQAAFAHAHAHGLDEHTISLAAGLSEIWFSEGAWPSDIEIHRAAADAAARLDQPDARAAALTTLGHVCYLTGDYPEAADAGARALELSEQTSNRQGEATALSLLGRVWHATGDTLKAAHALERAMQIHHQIGSPHGVAAALDGLGHVRLSNDDYPGATEAFTQALEIVRQLGFTVGEADLLNDLGRVRFLTGDLPGALHIQERALEIYRQTGHRGNESYALNDYAATIAATGNRTHALALYQQALAMNRELNKPDDVACSLEGIAEHHLATGNPAQGTMYLREAFVIYERLGLRLDIERVKVRLAAISARAGG